MTAVEIADVEAALGKVRAFITLLEQNHAAWDATDSTSAVTPPLLKQTDDQIQEELPFIRQIAARVDADLAGKLNKQSGAYGWSYYQVNEASPPTRRSAQLC